MTSSTKPADDLEQYFHVHGERLKLPAEIPGSVMVAIKEYVAQAIAAARINRAETCELCGGLSQNHLATDPLNLDHKFKRAEERVCKWQWLEELDGLFLRECGYTSAMKTPFCPNCGGKVVEIKDGEL